MKNLFFYSLILFMNIFMISGQSSIPSADLLDVKFRAGGEAIDNSPLKFTILKGSVSPATAYDSSIKQYVSQYRNSTGNQFFRLYYGDKTTFLNQMKESFTIEIYAKIKSGNKGVPFASTQSGGLGIAQNDTYANKMWFYQSNNAYAQVGSGGLYTAANDKFDHIVYTYNKSTKSIKYYLNGILITTATNINDLKLASQQYQWFFIGGDVSAVDNKAEMLYYGDIASIKMYGKELTDSEIKNVYNHTISRNDIKEIDQINQLITDLLPSYIESETDASKKALAEAYLQEGWDLMYSENIDQQTVLQFINKIQTLIEQYIVPSPNLLDVRFRAGGEAVDNSPIKFSILKGSVTPVTAYDSSIKQYVSQYRNNSGNQFFRLYYGDKTAFKDQMSESFTMEIYTKIKSSNKGVPFASTQSGGLGIAQNDTYANKMWFYQSNNAYAQVGSGGLYTAANDKFDHIVYTYNKSTKSIKYYLNGNLITQTTNINDLKLGPQQYHWFFIGGDVSPTDNKAEMVYYGDIASVKMYGKELSGFDVKTIYNQTISRNSIKEMDQVNELITDLLTSYIQNETDASKKVQAEAYLQEGWDLMYSENVDQQTASEYVNKTQNLISQYVPTADLLDVKFMDNSDAKDVSNINFTLEKGSTLPYNFYDSEIKQYVSSFSNYNIAQSSRFYKIDYRNNSEFINKLLGSFSIELYVKARSPKLIAPLASTQGNGFGVSQVENGGDLQFLFSDGSGYNRIGGKSIYSANSPEYNHIVYTYNAATNILQSFYNGVLTSSQKTLRNLIFPDANYRKLFIGGDVGSNDKLADFPYEGEIAVVRMYGHSLNKMEVNSLYQQVNNRKSIKNIDELNVIISNKLPAYIVEQKDITKKSLAEDYTIEGWDLMNNLTTTQIEVDTYLNKVKNNLGIDSNIIVERKMPRFAVISDVHIGLFKDESKFIKTIEILNNENLDAVFINGDLTNNGTYAENTRAATLLSTFNPNLPVYTLLGNHDIYDSSGMNYFKTYFGNVHKAFEIKGYPFIVLSIDPFTNNDHYNASTISFLTNALADAARKYPNKPIFVHAHVAAYNTVLGSSGEFTNYFYSNKINNVLKQYEQAVLFTGHIHTSIGDERSIHQRDFTAVNDGTIAYSVRQQIPDKNGALTGILNDNPDGSNRLVDADKVAEGLIVEVEDNEDVKITRWDFLRDKEIKTPWVLKAPHKKGNFVYTQDRNGGNAPYFEPTSQITFSNVSGVNSTITFTQAKDDDVVDYYKIQVVNENGNVVEKEYNISSKFHLYSDMPSELSWNITTTLNKQYYIKITAFDSFGNVSAPLVSQLFKTGVGVVSTTKSLNIETSGEIPVVLNNDKYIKVVTNGNTIETASLYDMTGNTIDQKSNQKLDFKLGENVISGIYIVNIIYDGGKVLNKKVRIQ